MESSRFTLSDLKAQASRLEEYLRAGGVQIKHTNALEAVARMHGAKDWQTLAATVGDAYSDQSAPAASYVVVTNYSDVTNTSVSMDRGIAIRDFLQTARMIIGVIGTDAQRVEVLGQDIDDGLPMLSLVIDDVVWCTLQQPSSPSTEKMSGNRPVPGNVARLTGIDAAAGYLEIAEAVTAAFNTVDLQTKRKTQERLSRSIVAHMLSMNYCEVARELAAETKKERNPVAIGTAPELLMAEIDSIRMMYGFVATVRAPGEAST